MGQQLVLNTRGIVSDPSPFTENPGAMEDAINVVIDRDGTIDTRRGQKRYGNQLTNIPDKIFYYNSQMIVNHDGVMSYDSDNAGTWVDYSGTYNPPTDFKMRNASSNKNFYFTTDEGVKKIDDITLDPINAGMFKGLPGTAALGANGSVINGGAQVAYRIVWGYEDKNKNLILGEPSDRIELAHASGSTKNVDLVIQIPEQASETDFFQVYRSGNSINATTPGDEEMGLVYEANPSAIEIGAGQIAYTDETPDELRGAKIYIAPSQEGILNANVRPPLCKDFTTYKNSLLYGNTETVHRFFITLLGVGATALNVGDTITIGGTVYTGISPGVPANNEFQVFTSGTVSENIANTATSIILAVNNSTTNTTISAYNATAFGDLPGKMRFENNDVAGSGFNFDWVNSGHPTITAFSPKVPTGGLNSDNEVKVNRVYFSKPGEPEAVPYLNYIDIGSEEFPIERIIGLRDSVFVFKKDGVYRILGEPGTDLAVRLFDSTAVIKGRESAIVFNNYIVCITLLGICSVSDSGVSVLSRDIEDKLLPLFSDSRYPNFDDIVFGVAYDSEKIFMIFTPKTDGSTQIEQAFVYNTFTQAWVRWEMNRTLGLVDIADDLLYMGSSDKYIYQERKSLTRYDYADEDYDLTLGATTNIVQNINNIDVGNLIHLDDTTGFTIGGILIQGDIYSGIIDVNGTDPNTVEVEDSTGFVLGACRHNAILINTGLSDISVGQYLLQGSLFSEVLYIDLIESVIGVADAIDFAAGAATVNDPIRTSIEWLPQYAQNPAMIKNWQEVIFIFRQLTAKVIATYKSNYSTLPESLELSPYVASNEGSWGTGNWGSPYVWGGETLDEGKTIRTWIPREKTRSQWISISISTYEAFSLYELAGISVKFDNTDTRMR